MNDMTQIEMSTALTGWEKMLNAATNPIARIVALSTMAQTIRDAIHSADMAIAHAHYVRDTLAEVLTFKDPKDAARVLDQLISNVNSADIQAMMALATANETAPKIDTSGIAKMGGKVAPNTDKVFEEAMATTVSEDPIVEGFGEVAPAIRASALRITDPTRSTTFVIHR